MISQLSASHVCTNSKPAHHSKSKTNGTFCKVCSIFVPNEASLKAHLDGQKHKRNISRQEEWIKKANNSLYVSGIKCIPAAELALADYFSAYSSVKKITIDKTLKHYAIVELEDSNVVKNILEQRHHIVNGVSVVVKAREVKSSQERASLAKNGDTNVNKEVLNQYIVDELTEATNVEQQVMILQIKLQLTPDEISLRDLLCQLLQSALQEAFPGCLIKPFGSSSNGFGVSGCDLDLHFEYDTVHPDILHGIFSQDDAMEIPDNRLASSPKTASTNEILLAVAEIIKQCVPDCHKVKAILTARLPVVRFHHKTSQMKCDISLANHLAVHNTAYLRYCWQLEPSFKSLVFVVRAWMKRWELAGGVHTNGPRLNNYAVTLMVLFYMQHSGQIPSLDEMRSRLTGPRTLINGWDCTFPLLSQVPSINGGSCDSQPIEENLAQFFEFYSNIDFAKTVLDLSIAKFIPTSNLSPNDRCQSEQPGSQKVASEYAELDGKSLRFKVGPLNIRDPFDLLHNVAGNVNEKHMRLMTKCIRNAVLASKMKVYRVKPQGNTKWGILNLFIDHHHKKDKSTVKENSMSCTEYVFFVGKGSNESEFDCAAAGGLILTVLQDIFKISCESVSHLPTTEDMATDDITEKNDGVDQSDVSPIVDDCVDTSCSSNVIIDMTRKRRADAEPCGYCKRAKLMLSSPVTQQVSFRECKPVKLPYTAQCIATHKLWQGRRKARRKLVQKGKADLLELERQVSQLLLSDHASSSQTPTVEMDNSAEDLNSSTSSSGTTPPSGVFKFTLTLMSEGDSPLRVSFCPYSKNADFITFCRHLETFLPGFIVKCLKQ